MLIPPNSFALCETVEIVSMPREYLAICVGKSTYARCGIIVNVTPIEPEWRGQDHAGNQQHHPAAGEDLRQRRDRAAHFPQGRAGLFKSYADKSGKYQDQKGLTLPKVD